MNFEGLPNLNLDPEKMRERMRNYPYNAGTKSLMLWVKGMAEELEKAPADINWNMIVDCATNIADIAKSNVVIQERETTKQSGGKQM